MKITLDIDYDDDDNVVFAKLHEIANPSMIKYIQDAINEKGIVLLPEGAEITRTGNRS